MNHLEYLEKEYADYASLEEFSCPSLQDLNTDLISCVKDALREDSANHVAKFVLRCLNHFTVFCVNSGNDGNIKEMESLISHIYNTYHQNLDNETLRFYRELSGKSLIDQLVDHPTSFKSIKEFAKYLMDNLSADGCGPENNCDYDRYVGANYNVLLTFDIEEHIKEKRYSVFEVDAITNQTMEVHSCPTSLRGLTKLLESIVDREFESMNESYVGQKVLFYKNGWTKGAHGKELGVITKVDNDGFHIYDSKRPEGQQNHIISLDAYLKGEKKQQYRCVTPRKTRCLSIDEQISAASEKISVSDHTGKKERVEQEH